VDDQIRSSFKRTAIFILVINILILAGAYAVFTSSFNQFIPMISQLMSSIQGQDSKILETGLPGTAKILSINQTGTYFNHNPQVELELKITPAAGGASYDTKLRMFLQMAHLPQFQPGRQFPVKISKEDKMKVAADFQQKENKSQPSADMNKKK